MRPIETLEPRLLSTSIFEQLLDRIVDGEMEPGEALPSERELCASFGVNRMAVREALKRLQQLNVIAVRQGGATRVLDPLKSGGLDLLVAMVFGGDGRLRDGIVRSLVEVRSLMGPEIAKLAAKHRSDDEASEIKSALERMVALERADYVNLHRQHLELWRVLVAASGNIVFQLMFNSMERAWGELQDALAFMLIDEITDLAGYQMLVRAVIDGEVADAEQAARRLVIRGGVSLLAAVERMEAAHD